MGTTRPYYQYDWRRWIVHPSIVAPYVSKAQHLTLVNG